MLRENCQAPKKITLSGEEPDDHFAACLSLSRSGLRASTRPLQDSGLRLGAEQRHRQTGKIADSRVYASQPLTAAEELLELIMRRYEPASTLVTSNRPMEDWGKLLGDAAAVSAMLDRLLHHGHLLKCGPRSWRTKAELTTEAQARSVLPDQTGTTTRG